MKSTTYQSNNNLVVEVKDVHKSFKTVKAVKGVNLTIQQGQFIAILGPNGAGKTTLVEMIEGIQKPDRGEILILGKHWKGNEDELHRHIGLSLQETRFIDKLTVNETLKLFASFYELGQSRVDQIISLVELEAKSKSFVVDLSGGQRQRLALGISLLNTPKILILDEPTTGLDPNARREIWSILFKLKEESQTSLILTTHYMEEAEQLCDYIIIIDKGQILKEGTQSQLLDNTPEQKMIEFALEEKNDSEQEAFSDAPYAIQWNERNSKGIISLKNMEADLPVFLSYLKSKKRRLKNMECRRKTLDDLFISLTGRRLDE